MTGTRFNFASEYIIWAAKSAKSKYYLNFEKMTELSYVLRKGFEVCGIYTIDTGGPVKIFSDTDLGTSLYARGFRPI